MAHIKMCDYQLIIFVLDHKELSERRREDQVDLEELEMTEVTDSTQEVVDATDRELRGDSERMQGVSSPGRRELLGPKKKRTGTKAQGRVRQNILNWHCLMVMFQTVAKKNKASRNKGKVSKKSAKVSSDFFHRWLVGLQYFLIN